MSQASNLKELLVGKDTAGQLDNETLERVYKFALRVLEDENCGEPALCDFECEDLLEAAGILKYLSDEKFDSIYEKYARGDWYPYGY
jgi:hypothetical protein